MKITLAFVLLAACATANPTPVTSAPTPPPVKVTPTTTPSPATPLPTTPAALFGTGLEAPLQGATCDDAATRCAAFDRLGHLAVVERSTGAVLATTYFGEVEALRFDASGEWLGVGGHHVAVEWRWRTGEVTTFGDSKYRDASALNPSHHAWAQGRGGKYDVVVTPRTGGEARVFSTVLVKTMQFVADDTLLVVHSDSLELLRLTATGPLERIAALTLPAEPEPRVRGYGGRPVVHVSPRHVWVEALPNQVLVLDKHLQAVTTLERPRALLVVDPNSERYALLQEQATGLTEVSVADLASGKALAKASVQFSAGGRAFFSGEDLVFSSYRGVWAWRLGQPPVVLESSAPHEVLAVVGQERFESLGAAVQFAPLASKHVSGRALSHGVSFSRATLRLFEDHAVIASTGDVRREESWSAKGIADVVSTAVAEPTREADGYVFASGKKLKFKPSELPALSLITNAQQTRAIAVMEKAWRLYDVASGALLTEERAQLEWERGPLWFSDDGRSLLIVSEQWLTLYNERGRVVGRFQYFKPEADGLGRSSPMRAHVVWAKETLIVGINQQLWFLHSKNLKLIASHAVDSVFGLERTKTGVVARHDDGLTLFDERGVERRHLKANGPHGVSPDGALLAFCDGERLTAIDELGLQVDEDEHLCARAMGVGVSSSQLATLHDGVVEVVRRDDRCRWQLRSFSQPTTRWRMGPRRSSDSAVPPRTLVVQHDGTYDVWPTEAAPFVTTVGGATKTSGLFERVWAPPK